MKTMDPELSCSQKKLENHRLIKLRKSLKMDEKLGKNDPIWRLHR